MEEGIVQNQEALDSQFELTVSEDRLKVSLTCSPQFAAGSDAVDVIVSELKSRNIVAKPDLEMLETALKDAQKAGGGIVDLPVVVGQEPQMPVDGKMEWLGDYFTEGYYIDPDTKIIDFHRRVGNPSVEENELLVRVTRGQPGQDGRDVYGRVVSVRRPREVSLRFGSNLYWDEAESGYRAKCSGRVRLRRQEVDVDPICYLKDGVGIESGDINHNGKVIIDGDVEMDFKVEATGDIEIRGLAYASDIICGGNLAVRGGINGHPSRRIEVKGDILAQYIMNAIVRSEGKILSNNEIINCDIETSGELNCIKGRIIGGAIHAAKGIFAGEAGSPSKPKTLLSTGFDYNLQNKLRSINKEINRLRRIVDKLHAAYRNIKVNLRIFGDEGKEKMAEIQSKLSEGEEEIQRLEAEKKIIGQKMLEYRGAVIKIHDIVHPGVVIRICNCQHIIQHALAGPLVARLDAAKSKIELQSEEDDSKE